VSARESLLPEALARLTLFDVAKACGIEIKVGVQRSPFREDRKESFSVMRNRTGWKDHASGDGGSIWHFAKRCMPAAADGDIARFLIGLAGLDQEAPAGAPRPPMAKRPEPRKERAFVHADKWSDLVYRRWMDGVGSIAGAEVKRLAERRGWQESWVWNLRWLQKLSYPILPWCEPSESHARRAWAFRVERLRLVEDGGLYAEPVGYHQPFEMWDKELRKARKSYIYVPYEPAPEKQKTNFQRFLRGTVPPYPFFLGSRKPRLLVVFEGQWDAATFFFCALSEHGDSLRDPAYVGGLPWAVVGLRGVQSVEAALEVLGPYLRSANPDVWIWPDNDAAGSALLANVEGKAPCFRDRVRVATWGKVVVSKVPRVECAPGRFAKDFNDMHQYVAPVTAADVRKIADAAGLGLHFAPAKPVEDAETRARSEMSRAVEEEFIYRAGEAVTPEFLKRRPA